MRIFLSALIGAVIGYITNFIAIKMLFRPYEEKKLFGIKIPFTPGLIPKERERIANSIGNTIGDHLLTPEVITEALSSQGFKIKIRKWIEGKLKDFIKSDKALLDCFKSLFGERYITIKEKLNGIIANALIEQLKNEESKRLIINYIVHEIKKMDIKELIESVINNNKENIKILINEMIFKEDLKNITLKNLISEDFADKIKDFIITNKDNIAGFIKTKLKTPMVRAKISELLYDILQQNIGKFVAMLISPEFITQKALTSIDEYLSKPENKTAIALMINNIIDNLLELKVNDVIELNENEEELKDKICEKILELLSKTENLEKVSLTLNDMIKNNPNLPDILLRWINKFIEDPKYVKGLQLFIASVIDKILNTKLNSISHFIDEETINELIDLLSESTYYVLKENSHYFIEGIDIPRIVENRINQLDVEYAEKIILYVAHRELSAITWLGALLGGILGLMNPLIQILLK